LADFMPTFLELASAPEPKQSIDGASFLPQLLGKKGSPKEWVHIEYIKNRQIRNKEWTYTNKGDLIKVNQLGDPENLPEKTTDHLKTRKEMKRILNKIPTK
jgi:arylsulfatase A-like enzyme